MYFKEEYSMNRGFSKKWGTSLMIPEPSESLNKLRLTLEKTDKPILATPANRISTLLNSIFHKGIQYQK